MIERIFKDKISCIFLSLVISLNLLGFYSFLLLPAIASAQQTENSEAYCRDLTVPDPQNAGERIDRYIKLGIPIPGFTQTIEDKDGNKIHVVKDLSCYIYYFYKYFASVVGILAAVMIIWGGFKYLTSFGNPSRISGAKEQITSAIIGLFITLGTYVILFTINPSIVNLRMPAVTSIKQIKQSTIWCADSIFGPPQECGKPEKNSEGQTCYWHVCDNENDVCVLEEKFVCRNARDFCYYKKISSKNYRSGSECSEVNKYLERAGFRNIICRPYEITPGGEKQQHCNLSEILKCPVAYERASCENCGEELCKDGYSKCKEPEEEIVGTVVDFICCGSEAFPTHYICTSLNE